MYAPIIIPNHAAPATQSLSTPRYRARAISTTALPSPSIPTTTTNPRVPHHCSLRAALDKATDRELEYYPGRDADIIWLVNFLAPFTSDHSLAKISGRQKDDYTHMYPSIVSRMKKQPRFPIHFMQMNPDRSLLQPRGSSEAERPREMSDVERRDIIDFCDAAAEWGSSVPIPAQEADRMIELAGQRRIADLGLEQRQSRFQPSNSPSSGARDVYTAGNSRRGDDSSLQGQERADLRDRSGRRVSFADERLEFENRRI